MFTTLPRNVLLICAAGALMLTTAFLSWQRVTAERTYSMQLQQYAELARLSLKPYLTNTSSESLTTHLRELQYSALQPIVALGIYQTDGENIAVAGAVELLPSQLPQPVSANFHLQQLGSALVATQPLYKGTGGAESVTAFGKTAAFLVFIPEGAPSSFDLLGLAAVLAIYVLVCLAMYWVFKSWLHHHHRHLASIVQQQFEQLPQQLISQDEADKLAPDRVLPLMLSDLLQQELSRLIRVSKQSYGQATLLNKQLLASQQVLRECEIAQQESERRATKLQQQLSHWLRQYQLLVQRQEQLAAPVYLALYKLHFLYGVWRFTAESGSKQSIALSEFLAEHLTQLNSLLPQGMTIDWLERSENVSLSVMHNEDALLAVLQAMLLVALRSEGASKLTMRLRACSTESVLQLQLSCNGSGLPSYINKQLHRNDVDGWQWRDADIAALQGYATLQHATLKVQSLEGFGSSITLQLPVTINQQYHATKVGQLIVFDEDAERLSERMILLNQYAHHVTACSTLGAFQQKLAVLSPQIILLFLPDEASVQEWITVLNLYREHSGLQVFTSEVNLQNWRSVIPVASSSVFCSNVLRQLSIRCVSATAVARANPKNLLVVDDNETNQAFIQVLLKPRAVQLQAALTGKEVFELCQQHQFDMILLDIQLPDLQGTEVARRLRTLPAYRTTPILAFTAHALPAEVEQFKAAGMDDVLLKPLDPSKFETLLARYELY